MLSLVPESFPTISDDIYSFIRTSFKKVLKISEEKLLFFWSSIISIFNTLTPFLIKKEKDI